jgi:hypothetical protein
MMGKYQKLPYSGILREIGKGEHPGIAGEGRLSKKWVEAGMKYGS